MLDAPAIEATQTRGLGLLVLDFVGLKVLYNRLFRHGPVS